MRLLLTAVAGATFFGEEPLPVVWHRRGCVSDLDRYANLVTRNPVSSDDGVVTLSPFVFDDQLRAVSKEMEMKQGENAR